MMHLGQIGSSHGYFEAKYSILDIRMFEFDVNEYTCIHTYSCGYIHWIWIIKIELKWVKD